MSPGYPHGGGHSLECSWRIFVNAGSKVNLLLVDLAMSENYGCMFDYLQVM